MLIVGAVWVVIVLAIGGFFNGASQVNEEWDRGSDQIMRQLCQVDDKKGACV